MRSAGAGRMRRRARRGRRPRLALRLAACAAAVFAACAWRAPLRAEAARRAAVADGPRPHGRSPQEADLHARRVSFRSELEALLEADPAMSELAKDRALRALASKHGLPEPPPLSASAAADLSSRGGEAHPTYAAEERRHAYAKAEAVVHNALVPAGQAGRLERVRALAPGAGWLHQRVDHPMPWDLEQAERDTLWAGAEGVLRRVQAGQGGGEGQGLDRVAAERALAAISQRWRLPAVGLLRAGKRVSDGQVQVGDAAAMAALRAEYFGEDVRREAAEDADGLRAIEALGHAEREALRAELRSVALDPSLGPAGHPERLSAVQAVVARYQLEQDELPAAMALPAARAGLWVPAAEWSPEHDAMMDDHAHERRHVRHDPSEQQQQRADGRAAPLLDSKMSVAQAVGVLDNLLHRHARERHAAEAEVSEERAALLGLSREFADELREVHLSYDGGEKEGHHERVRGVHERHGVPYARPAIDVTSLSDDELEAMRDRLHEHMVEMRDALGRHKHAHQVAEAARDMQMGKEGMSARPRDMPPVDPKVSGHVKTWLEREMAHLAHRGFADAETHDGEL